MTVRQRAKVLADRVRGARARAGAQPAAPEGWLTGPPDFVGVGVQRAGTSWWFAEITNHPGVRLAPGAPKEVHFFDSFSSGELDATDITRYWQWFPRSLGSLVGEWTPCYLYDPWTLPLLRRAAPDARLLVMLRDPLERFRSAMAFQLRRRHSHADAVRDAFQRGLYSNQVARLLQTTPQRQVSVMLYEQACDEPASVRRATAQFLGLEPDRWPESVTRRPRRPASDLEVPGLSRSLVADLRARYQDDVAALTSLLPDVDFGWWATRQRRSA